MTTSDKYDSSMNDSLETDPDVCVVTHPLGGAGENATRTLLDILAAITSVRLVTADLPADSAIRHQHTFVELTEQGAGQSNVVVAAVRFVLNQFRMCREIVKSDEDVILFFGATAYVLPMIWARLIGRTVIIEPRGDVPLTLRLNWEQRMPAGLARALVMPVWLLERAGYRIADAIVTYTPAMATELDLDRFEEKLYTTGARYVDTERFAPVVPFEERDQVVGFLGRIDEEKGIRELAAVAESLPEDLTFRFVGDGHLLPWLRERLSEEIEAEQVELAGWVNHDDVPQELNRFRLLVMPSSPTEGLPTTILEALACGTPVYAKPVSGVPDVIREDETGFLMDGTKPCVIHRGIVDILSRENLDRVSANGRRLAESEFSFEAAHNRYRRILSEIDD